MTLDFDTAAERAHQLNASLRPRFAIYARFRMIAAAMATLAITYDYPPDKVAELLNEIWLDRRL